VRSSILLRLRRCYEPIADEEQRSSLLSRYIYRPISFYLSVPFVLLNTSANGVTLLRIPIAAIATLLVAVGPQALLLAGGFLHAIGTLLDYVDGNLARLGPSHSIFGELLDGTVHIFERCIFPIGIAVGLCFRPDHLCRTYGASPPLLLTAGFLTSMAGFSRTSLSVLQIITDKLGMRMPPSNHSPVTRWSLASKRFTSSSVMREGKYIVRRLLTEGGLFLDGIGVVVLSALDLMSLFLIAAGIQNAFRLRDELQMSWDLLHKDSTKAARLQGGGR